MEFLCKEGRLQGTPILKLYDKKINKQADGEYR